MALTKEEQDELDALEREEKDRLSARADASKRQHLEAMRMSKRLATKWGEPGIDFAVLETTHENMNVAIRRPQDVELDAYNAKKDDDDRSATEAFCSSITIEPTANDLALAYAKNARFADIVLMHAFGLLKATREVDAKK